MKDISIKNIPKDTIYKDVVVIGNGPSGISLSYMLAGNWPYWNTEKINKHPDDILKARLQYADSEKSLVEQNLEELSEGLEGRSTNPISLLFDSLEHPCADLGMELPSMLEYIYDSNRKIDHIVLGKGSPGGSWHRMDPNLRTLSLAAWMSLPGLSFSDWSLKQLHKELITKQDNLGIKELQSNIKCTKCVELQSKAFNQHKIKESDILENLFNNNYNNKNNKNYRKNNNNNNNNNNSIVNNNNSEMGALCCKCSKNSCNVNDLDIKSLDNIINSPPRRNLSLKGLFSNKKEVQSRALVSNVAQYYEDYVRSNNLSKYFMNDAVCTLVAPIHADALVNAQGKLQKAKWIVSGINKATGRPFYYGCRKVVLANGVSDLANRLGLRGEQDSKNLWIKHELPELESDLEGISNEERINLKPVVVVGAGLSAADAVSICRSSDIPVIHIFRNRSVGLDKMLPENVYPEYHQVHRMMKEPPNTNEFYTPMPEHTISDLTTNSNGQHKVTVRHLITNETKTFEVSYVAILIGSRPDLRFTSGITKQFLNNQIQSPTITAIRQIISPTSCHKLSWLKTICAKCKQINLCNRRKLDFTNNSKISLFNLHHNSWEIDAICLSDDNGIGLGVNPDKPVDSKSNQISVDKFTNEITRTSIRGLYAMGPLVGDNFVRFIPGGALAITSALKDLNQEND